MKDIKSKVEALRAVQPHMRSTTIEKYIRAYENEIVVIKYGGGAMTKPSLKKDLALDLALMKKVGIRPILVHGGGPEITEMMKRLKMDVEFIGGYRKTDSKAIEIVKMVLLGKVNSELVGLVNSVDSVEAVGLSGLDSHLIQAEKKKKPPGLGFVGDVKKINTTLILSLIEEDYIPVIASVGIGEDGKMYNINADSVAAAIAVSLEAHHIMFLTDVDGILRDIGDHKSLISEMTADHIENLVEKNKISGGMIPKIAACLEAIKGGVGWAHILNGTHQHVMLQEIFTKQGAGTMIKKDN